jgi:hypothetical protein
MRHHAVLTTAWWEITLATVQIFTSETCDIPCASLAEAKLTGFMNRLIAFKFAFGLGDE